MVLGLAITFGFLLFVWLVFFKFKLLKWSAAWAVVALFVFVHVLLIFLIGVRFVSPYSTDARVIQHTIQLIPRLPEPTLVTDVMIEPNSRVKKGQPLFQFDRRPYEYSVDELKAELAKARQNVLVLGADVDVAREKEDKARADLAYSTFQRDLANKLVKTGAGSEDDAQKWLAQMKSDEAAVKEAQAEVVSASLKYDSQIDGVNTTVASVQAKLDQAQYYLDNTLMVAPEDGLIVSLQVRPGMVAGIVRAGAIASLICDADRYVLASINQEELKYVEIGQPAEVALARYPGQIFDGRVEGVWPSGTGQLLPSGKVPKYHPLPPELPQRRFAVVVTLNDPDQSKFEIGTQGAVAIYTSGGGYAAMRRIGIRAYSWLNFLYPLPF
jgi:multidrug resistance efflux pump